MDTSGTVDGLSTLETISLDEEQRIGGLTTFTQLEVTETLDVSHLTESYQYILFLQSFLHLGQGKYQRETFE